MKKIVNFLICLTLSLVAIGQNETQSLTVEIEGIEVTPPKFTGSEYRAAILDADHSLLIKDYLLKNVICTRSSSKCQPEGIEIVQFTVTPSGEVANITVINSVSPKIDKELIRVLNTTSGMWKPGYINGEPNAMVKELSMIFTVGEYNYSAVINRFTHNAINYYEKGSMNLLVKNNPKKALRLYNKGVQYKPHDKCLLMLRGICHYELGDTESAKRDWNRIVFLGGIDFGKFHEDLVGMKGYSNMTDILAKMED